MDEPVKLCGNCDHFRQREGLLSSICLMSGRAVSKIMRPCRKYMPKNADEEAEPSTNTARPYKSVKWPFQRIEPERMPELDICSIRPVKYNSTSFEDTALHFAKNIVARVIDMRDQAIYNEIIKTAREAGIDELILMDKQFVLDALREKLEREGYGKIT